MKRYKLKKDLPTFKVGQECWLDLDGQLLTRTEEGKIILVYNTIEMKKFPKILTDWFEEIPEQPKTVWDLKGRDKYYSIASDGFITTEICKLETQYEDGQRIALGNAFLTREEAEKELARRRAKVILERDTKGFKPDWTDESQDRFCVSFYLFCGNRTKGHLGHLQVENAKWSITREIYFASQADAEASVKAHPEEWKTYLGVEE